MDKLKELKEVMHAINEGSVTTKDLQVFIATILEFVKNHKNEFLKVSQENLDDMQSIFLEIEKRHDEILNNVDKKTAKAEKEFSHRIQEVKSLVNDVKSLKFKDGLNGKDGKDADEERIIASILSTIRIPESKQETGKTIIDKINELPADKDNQIDASHIKNLPINNGGSGIGGRPLYQLPDVNITTPTNGQVLKYNSTTQLWENGTDVGGVAWGGITGTLSNQTDLQSALDLKVPTTRTLTINGTAYDLSADRSWTIATAASLINGTTTISSGSTGRILYDNAGVLGEYTLTGTGTVVAMQTAPTFITNITTPIVIGGTGTTDNLILKTTTGVGTSSGWIKSQVGNNGSIEPLRQGVVDSPDAVGSGGTVTTSGGYTIHTFTSSGNFIVSGGTLNVDYLVVGGGGGGGSVDGGGGGAGGMKTGSISSLVPGTYPITVGGGGAGSTTLAAGSNGSDSVFSTVTAHGGGGGGSYNGVAGSAGGSGGGGGANGGGSTSGGTGTGGEGNNGGAGKGPSNYAGAGGGGAGAVGGDAAATGSAGGGNGGAGSVSSISGSSVTYAGGGGGGTYLGTAGSGGAGGGGAGTNVNSGTGTAGTANTGGGGGGGGDTSGKGGAGGSGIVIIRYLTPTTTQRPVVGVNKSAPTAQLHLGAGVGNPYSAPLKFDSGTNLAVAEAGAMEYDGTSLFFTPSSTRYNVLMNGLGLAGGQTIVGGTASGNNLTLSSTSNATKGKILFGTSAYDEANNRLGIGTTTPANLLSILGNSTTPGGVSFDVKNSNVSGDTRFSLSSSNNRTLNVQVTGDSYVVNQKGAYLFTNGGLSNMTFMTDGDVGSGGSGYISFATGGYTLATQERMRITSTGNIGIGQTSPTARLMLPAGTATASTAPLKFTSGTNLTTAEAGAIEYNNTFHVTNSDATRRHVVTAPNTTKVTASAPYTNDGYIIINIGGTDFKVMTTA